MQLARVGNVVESVSSIRFVCAIILMDETVKTKIAPNLGAVRVQWYCNRQILGNKVTWHFLCAGK
jgi:hypothetical protein